MATPQLLKRLLSSNGMPWILSSIGSGYVLLVRWTSRIDRPAPPIGGPFIVALWHGRLALLHQLRLRNRSLVALISGHRDGELIAKCAWYFNILTVRGSTSRGGALAVRQLMQHARRGHDIIITPDGPRGPHMRVNKGIIKIAHLTKLPILPAAIGVSASKELRSWDRFSIPAPCSRIVIRWGELLTVGSDADVSGDAARLEQALTQLQEAADIAAGH